MAKEWCNEAERYLIQHWSSARLMEQAMESVRKKYTGVFQRVVETLQRTRKEFDHTGVFVTQFWGDGFVFLSRTAWKRREKQWPPPGFYIGNLRLELLCAEDEPPPYAGIRIPAKGRDVDTKALTNAVRKLLTEKERKRCPIQQEDGNYPLYYDLPETRADLLDMLLDGEADRFVDCMVSHLELLARFTPVLDKLLASKTAGRK
jgi:hypothetical protein